MKKLLAVLSAAMLTAVTAFPYVGSVSAADSYDMTVNVDMADKGKAISPYIYGINQYGHENEYKNLNVTAVRQGGNRMTAYNWENNASNAGSDWQHSSDDNLSKSDRPADCVQVLSADGEKYGFYKLATLQLAGYVAADKNGIVSEYEAAPSDRWNEVKAVKGSPFSDTPDLTDGVVYMDEYVNYIVNKLGDSQTSSGIQAYSLDNEPALWSYTHSRMHPQPVTIKELAEKSIATAAAVKKIDPNAEIFGPALYGYTAYDHLADDEYSNEWETIKSENNYHWYLDCYLDQMKKASDDAGVRLLDVLDIHYYSESARNSAEDRVQSVRTLYEKGFAENSWIGQWCQENVPILPTIQSSIDKYYPGTKLAISEYNYGGENDPSGAIAQAEALGCYADNNVYFASLWGGSDYILSGLRLYTNYDGKGSRFGDTLLPTSTEDVSKASAYASVDSDDDSTVTVMVTNKDSDVAENAAIKLNGADKNYKSAAVYAVYGDSSDIRLLEVADVTDNTANITLPAYSAAMVVITEEKSDVTIEPEPEIKTEVFNDPMSMANSNGYVEIPITDPEHLKKIVMTADVTSSKGSAWGNAGCAVSINAVDQSGKNFWTYKSYSLSLGNASKATVTFDGTLIMPGTDDSSPDTEVNAVIADGKVELQKWWESSEKQEEGVEEIGVKYTKIEVFYEYPPELIVGDVNADGEFSLPDIILLQKWLLAVPNTKLADWKAADLYEDKVLNVFDLCMMKTALSK